MQGAGVPHRVVVTGLGVVTPIGTTVPEFWAACKRSQLGISPLDGFDLGDLKILIGAQIRDFDPKARLKHFTRDKIILHADRYSWFAAAAADEAIKQAGLEVPFKDGYRVACIVGSGAGGLADHGTVLPRPVHQQEARHPPAHPAALHRLVGGGACRHRVRRQGTDVRHLQRLLDGGPRHRHRQGLHPPRSGRHRHRRRLRERDQLRRHARLAGDARALARGLLPVRQEAQRHGAGRGCGHAGAGIRWLTPRRAAPRSWPSCAASA